MHAGLKCSLLPIQPKRCPPARSYPQLTGRSADFTSANLILPKLYERTTTGVINELNQRLQMHDGLPEHLFATTAAINHELLTGMKLDGGIVLAPWSRCVCQSQRRTTAYSTGRAQVRSTTLPLTRFALGRARETLPWR